MLCKSGKIESAGPVLAHGDWLCLLGFGREEITHAQNPPRMQNWEDLEIPERTERLEKSAGKHKGPIWKMGSKSIWRGLGKGSSTLRVQS